MNRDVYVSMETLYDIAKEEYVYQRERLQKIETKIELIMGLVSAVFTFEIVNAATALDIDFAVDSSVGLKKMVHKILCNIPYTFSLCLLIASIILLIYVGINVKCRIVDIVKLYNKKVYSKPKEELIPYLTALYVKCSAYNSKKINSSFRQINLVIMMSIVSVLLFGVGYLW